MKPFIAIALMAVCLPLAAQWKQDPTTGSSSMRLKDRTVLQGQVATTADFGVRLAEPEKLAKQKSATLQASVEGMELVDPDAAHRAANEHQAHIVYKVDDGQEATTTSTQFEIHGLARGAHRITVYLAGNDGRAISPEHYLNVKIPK